MFPLYNRSVKFLLGFCFLLIIGVIVVLILINRSAEVSDSITISPTPVQGKTPNQRDPRLPTAPPVYGEGGFNQEEIEQFQAESRAAEAAYQDRLRRMPFITKLPYRNSRFMIEITAVSDTVYITTFGPPSFQEPYRDDALSWLRQNGGNLQTLSIQYKN